MGRRALSMQAKYSRPSGVMEIFAVMPCELFLVDAENSGHQSANTHNCLPSDLLD